MLVVLLNIVFAFLLAGAGFVVLCENTVYSVFYLVFVFVNATALLLALGVNFLAMVFLIVYVGAIAVLFLFVVMMLSLKQIPWVKKKFELWTVRVFYFAFIINFNFCGYCWR